MKMPIPELGRRDVDVESALSSLGRFTSAIGPRPRARGEREVTLAAVLAFSIALPVRAAEVPKPPPVRADRSVFEHARDAAVGALEQGDVDTFLEQSENALRALPEEDKTHGERAQVMQPVGTDRLGERSERQLRRSIAILQLYVDDLEHAYRDNAKAKPGWTPAQEYLEDLRALVPAREPTPFLPMPSAKAQPTPEASDDTSHDRSARPGSGLVIGGSVSIGVGVVLLIAGLVQGAQWKQADQRYDDLRRQSETGTVTDDQEQDAAVEWARRAGGTLGTVIPGVVLVGVGTALLVVGVRKGTASDARVGLSPGGVEVRF